MEKITAERNARLVSSDKSARTTVTGDRLELAFDTSTGESQLRKAQVTGHGQVESVPLISGAAGLPATRVLRSESIDLDMRAGGSEVQSVGDPCAGGYRVPSESSGPKAATAGWRANLGCLRGREPHPVAFGDERRHPHRVPAAPRESRRLQ